MLQSLMGGLFRPRPAKLAGRALFKQAAARARQPALYEAGGAPDTVEGRFELYALHVDLVIFRLKGQGAEAQEVSQALFDTFLNNLDEGLRDMGVGDLSVGKKMRKLAEAIYGRMKGYDQALQALPDETPLKALLGRTIFSNAQAPAAGPLCTYAIAVMAGLNALPLRDVIDGRIDWPDFSAVAEGKA
jgi:cytochrome b pre-mRNA-processing protein 3